MSARHQFPWTDDQVERLRKAWNEGASAGEIARRFGVTRNTVMGKAKRLGLYREKEAQHLAARANFKAARKAREASLHPRQLAPGDNKPPAVTDLRAEPPGSATIHTLGAHACKWPIGEPTSDEFTYCGRRKDAGPYCAEHARRAYAALPGRKPRTGNDLARSLRRFI